MSEYECLTNGEVGVKMGNKPTHVDVSREYSTKERCIYDYDADPNPLAKYSTYECPPDKDILPYSQDLVVTYNIRKIPQGFQFVTLMIKAVLWVEDTSYDATYEWGRSYPDEDPDIISDRRVSEITTIPVSAGQDLYAASGSLIIDRIVLTYQAGPITTRLPSITFGGYSLPLIESLSNVPLNTELIQIISIPQGNMPELIITIDMS